MPELNTDVLEPETRDFYCHVMRLLQEAKIPFLVGGAYALNRYTGIERHTKDFDIFVRPAQLDLVLETVGKAGYSVERNFPHWLAKAFKGEDFVDFIYNSGNGLSLVDDGWFDNSVDGEIWGISVRLCPIEEILWTKMFIQERERYDGADVAHYFKICSHLINWERLIQRVGRHWRVLFSHVILFGFIYPGERNTIPKWVVEQLGARLQEELAAEPVDEKLCQGTLISRQQYLIDVSEWGYQDARQKPYGNMSAEDIAHWTAHIGKER